MDERIINKPFNSNQKQVFYIFAQQYLRDLINYILLACESLLSGRVLIDFLYLLQTHDYKINPRFVTIPWHGYI